MVTRSCLVIGMGLTLLAGVALAQRATPEVVWLDVFLAFAAFVGAAITAGAPRATRIAVPLALAATTFVVWFFALARGAEVYLTWWNFIGGAAFFVVGLGAAGDRRDKDILVRDEDERRPPRAA